MAKGMGHSNGTSNDKLALDSAAVRAMVSVMGGYAMTALLDNSGRQSLRERCSDRLRQEHGVSVQYAEQAVLANLDWGIDGLEKAVKATNPETRAARLEHTEKMLQVAVMLDPIKTTAGVPNSYLSAWANFYLALVWKLRNNDRNAALHLLETFLLEPSHARRDFAPELWEQLFRPHLSNIESWYQNELAQIIGSSPGVAQHARQSSDSHTAVPEFEAPRSSVNGKTSSQGNQRAKQKSLAPDQLMRLELLDKLYQDNLDENTQQYAQYYKDWLAYEADNNLGVGSPGLPRLEPPKTPQHRGNSALHAQMSHRAYSAGHGGHSNAGGSGSSTKKATNLRSSPAMDVEQDSFSDGSFQDAPSYSRNSSLKDPQLIEGVEELISEGIEEGSEEGIDEDVEHHRDYDKSLDAGLVDDSDNQGACSAEFEKGAGVFLDGEELTEDELLQVWEELSEGRISLQEANNFIGRLTDHEGRPLTFKKLSDLAAAAKSWRTQLAERQLVTQSGSHGNNAGKFSPAYSDNLEESDLEEEEQDYSRQSIDGSRPEGFMSRMTSQSSRSSCTALTIESDHSRVLNPFQPRYSRETSLIRPPKDFVCPITNQLFQDPVTLETGQTYERAAIQEWMDRGNTSCPITRQTLKSHRLPKINYVLKRLVDNWKDEHPEYLQDLGSSRGWDGLSHGKFGRSDSGKYGNGRGGDFTDVDSVEYQNGANIMNDEVQRPSRRFGQKVTPLPVVVATTQLSSEAVEDLLKELKPAVDILFQSEDLNQCERAVRSAAHIWVESRGAPAIATSLSKAGVVEGLMEVLSNSKKDDTLRSIVCLLCDLISKDEFTRHTVLRTDPELESIVSVLRNGRVPQAAVLIYLLKTPAAQLSGLKIIPLLVSVLEGSQLSDEGAFNICWAPKTAVVCVLEQLVTTLEHRANMANAEAIVGADGVPLLIDRLESKSLEEKISVVAVLWSCLQSDGGCRILMAQRLKVSSLVDMLHDSKEQSRTVAIFFLAELVKLNRRKAVEKILREVLREGFLNSMHVLMLHLQMSPLEHRPLVASLLLQLDLLAEPRKHSVYREEAVEALVAALASEENSKAQVEAARVLASLSGRYSSTGKPMVESTLLKYAGLDDEYTKPGKDGAVSTADVARTWEEDDKAADEWDKRMAVAVLGSGRFLIETLGMALPTKLPKLARPCVVAAAWLTCSLRLLPDTGLQTYARNCFLPALISLIQPGHDVEVRVLACLCMHNLTDDSVGVQQLTIFSKDLVGPLRRLKRLTWSAKKILEALASSPLIDTNSEMWSHGEVGFLDASKSGEIRALLYAKGHLYSGHADASIKVWAVKRRMPRLVQEVREHTRAVLCLAILEDGSKLFSGSADKTVKIWAVQDQRLKCLQTVEVKEAVHSVAVNSSFICVIPQGVGIKVLDASGGNARLLNAHKHVQSVTIADDRIYCGCTDSSIQEIEPVTGQGLSIQSGIRSLRGKKAVYSMLLFKHLLYTAGTCIEGVGAKVWRQSTRALVASISPQIDVRAMAVSEDFIYLASNSLTGTVEVWLREKYQKVSSFTVGSKVLSLALVGDTLYTASADGKLRAWALA